MNRVHHTPQFGQTFVWDCNQAYDGPDLKAFTADMGQFCRLSHRRDKFRVWFGDLSGRKPMSAHEAEYTRTSLPSGADSLTFTKVRRVIDGCGVLLPLNWMRHWGGLGPVQSLRSVPWHLKGANLVWRGSTSGDGLRRDFVAVLSDRFNVCFDGIVQERRDWITKPRMRCNAMARTSQLRHKYILMLPGNDVASGLKWSLASSSLVLMPLPQKETWLMEGRLQPWRHFVPVETPADVVRALNWLRAHDDEAKAIVQRANAFFDTIVTDMLTPVPSLFERVAARVARTPRV